MDWSSHFLDIVPNTPFDPTNIKKRISNPNFVRFVVPLSILLLVIQQQSLDSITRV
jgi:hypothetical protein